MFDELVEYDATYRPKTTDKVPKVIKSARAVPSGPSIVDIRRQLLFESLKPDSKGERYQKMHDAHQEKLRKIERSASQRRENEEKYSFTPDINKSSKFLASLLGKNLEERTEKFDIYYKYKQADLERRIRQREEDKFVLEMKKPLYVTERKNQAVESKVKKFIKDNYQTNGFKNTPIKSEVVTGKVPIQPILQRDAHKKTYTEMYVSSVGRSKSPRGLRNF